MYTLEKPKTGYEPATHDDFKNHVYFLTNRAVNPTLEDCYYPKNKILPSEDIVYMSWIDKKTNEKRTGNRTIRYIPGETSVFADEQSSIDIPRNRFGQIIFVDGMLVVDGRDKLKRQYLDLCNWNRSNSEFRMPGKPEIFFKEDKERKSENIIDTKKKIYELQGKVFECTESELQAYCMTFDVRNYQALNVNEMRTILLDMIQMDPNRFEKEMNSDERKRKYWVMKAFEEQYLQVSADRAKIEYTLGGIQTVCEVPSINTNHVEYLTDLSFRSPETNELIEKLIKLMKTPSFTTNRSGLDVTSNDSENEILYKEALKHKVLYKAGPWTRFSDKSLNDINLGKSMAEFCELIDNDLDLGQKIKMMLSEIKEG
jgi:hypothetical protein